MEEVKLYEMKLGNDQWIGSNRITRVPGGWIYIFYDAERYNITSSVFVPFDNEFQVK